MERYRLTLERLDNTWGQYVVESEDMKSAMRWVSRNVDLENAKNVHLVKID